MPALGSDGSGGLTSLQRPCSYQTLIRLILIREYLCLHPSCPLQATWQHEPWQLKIENCHLPSLLQLGKMLTHILHMVIYTSLGPK